MKISKIVILLLALNLTGTFALANECSVKLDKENVDFAFGVPGGKVINSILKKKGYTVVEDDSAKLVFSSYLRSSSSVWDMWSPISPSWSFRTVNVNDQSILAGATILGRTFFDSQNRRARKLKRSLKKLLPECQDL